MARKKKKRILRRRARRKTKRSVKRTKRKHASSATVVRLKKPKIPFDMKHLVSLRDVHPLDFEELFKTVDKIKRRPEAFAGKLKGKTLALVFQKPSTRTRVSFEVGMTQMGGSAIYLGPEEIQLGQREAIKDVARVLSRYVNGIVTRTYLHSDLMEMTRYASVPVLNGLSDLFHPCQILADLYTIREQCGALKKVNIAYVGDGNNVLNSLLYGAAKVGAHLAVATPRGYDPNEEIVKETKLIAKETGSRLSLSNNPFSALKNAHIIYTDVWVSMGQEKQTEQRLKDFQSFQINRALVTKAPKDVHVMHCLPARRGQEITDEVLEGAQSIIFKQAENRLHVQKGLLLFFLGRRLKK